MLRMVCIWKGLGAGSLWGRGHQMWGELVCTLCCAVPCCLRDHVSHTLLVEPLHADPDTNLQSSLLLGVGL